MRAFGMHVIGYDPIVSAEDARASNIEFKQLEEIWPVADFISIHVPLMPETKNLIDAGILAKCKKGVRLVNCARGGNCGRSGSVGCAENRSMRRRWSGRVCRRADEKLGVG